MHDRHHPLAGEMSHVRTGFHKLPDGMRMRYALCEPEGTPRGTMIIAPGRREFIEKKYAEAGREFIAKGFRLIIFEWRGQGLSDRFLEGPQRQRDYIKDFGTHLEDLKSLYDGVIKQNLTGPLLLHGHSMGGHLLLRWLLEQPAVPVKAALLTGPMLALSGPITQISANALCWGALKLHHGSDYAMMQHDYDAHDRSFAGNPLTGDPARFAIIENYFDAYPEMIVSGVTWEWLHAAVKSLFITQRKANLEKIKTPILSLIGSKDHVTPTNEVMRYLRLLPRGENFTIAGAMHDVLNEVDACRIEAWAHIDAFLKRIVGI